MPSSKCVDHAAPLPLALTMGEPGGIGLDLTIAAWRQREALALPAFVLFGCEEALQLRARQLGAKISLRLVELDEPIGSIFNDHLPVFPISAAQPDCCGILHPQNAKAVLQAIEKAVNSVFGHSCSALVTNPIHKKNLYDAHFAYPGHTEYLGALAEQHTGQLHTPVMMLVSEALRTVPVTLHIPLAEVPAALSRQKIIDTITICHHSLEERFGIKKPRLLVAGLNPHAGENGAIGVEDAAIIAPAVERLRTSGIDARGPLPADTMFHPRARQTYDAAICMYHDQALIPVKTLAFDTAVNMTLGLPFIRTSPDHGTALELAGTGKAQITSLAAALKLAVRLAKPCKKG